MAPTFGLQLPLLAPLKVLDVIVRLEALGFHRAWMPDHVLYPEKFPAAEAWSVLAAAAARTSRILLGTAVSDPHRLHPAVFAQRLATIDQLSRGRVACGLGAGEAMNLEPFGIAWNKPVSRLKEFLQVVRGLLDSPDPFTFEGAFFQVRDAHLAVRPHENRHLPFYLAALGPVMQRLAGEMADGWMPVVVPPEHYQEFYRPIEEAAVACGRARDSVEKVAVIALSLTDNEAHVLQFVEMMGLTLIWPPVLRKLGIDIALPPDMEKVGYASVNPCDPQSLQRYYDLRQHVPPEELMKFVCYGSVETIRQTLGRYVDAGVTHFNIVDGSPDPVRSVEVLAREVIPWFGK